MQPGRGILDVLVQDAELALEAGGVGDQVLNAAPAEHGALIAPHAAQRHRERACGDERDERQRASGECDDPGGARQLVHGCRG